MSQKTIVTSPALAEQIASDLLKIGAVALRPQQPFTWTSGLKSPIYCDNRLTISYPEIRERIADGFVQLIRDNFPDAEVIAGAATGGIPHAAWVAQKLGLPMVYVRDKAKGHGKENLIEGHIEAGQKTVVIEDLISTGGSSLKVALAVNDAGAQALGVLGIFSYQFEKAKAAFGEAGVPFETLTNYSVLLDVAVKNGSIQESDLQALRAWSSNPSEYGK
ncbi:orotate phosphoribosyltransferase [Paenibacillus mucilaginosus]|uniref:Orotate phosphoribosyltransferase n=3 Tax=Paenibacillus mucilaginosus TaxID=61624 RepID=H6NDQ5_9BACL|nr:orotate phosphoribosyltransferase [Paenibacillus mucilaginosus]AEI42566.1 PyrE [Paenibacillus mucilaginosus KNP414]AFC32104.1 PyrE [Paenibacillus mucilaginosus 3016]AFH64475.1 orotate phosphoribosyltransferase [Paenibacillus mucilaginosus K02]MCG7213957.1 orotate phosphoribosyltransferase [Paenibacillus mucilaginosus]WDM25959.1 orotate phosphoribosyltransferase [Paenibacillus mucilaginosus]